MIRVCYKAAATFLIYSLASLFPLKILAIEASLQHIGGYVDTGYIDKNDEYGSFFLGHFNPIFHFLYRDLILAEGELELEIDSEGKTEVKLEYADLALFINDYMILVAGKLLSPLGYFGQNLHPTWINKFPTSPPGFGSDQASPEAFVGAELRGAFMICPLKITYSIFVANGPKGVIEDDEIEEIEAEGFNADIDGSKIVGGRIAVQTWSEVSHFEVGISAATGGVGLFDEDAGSLIEKGRDYTVLGADAAIHFKNLELRGEIIQQKICSSSSSDISGGKWKGWYSQAAYKFFPTKFEGIIRYGKYHTPHSHENLQQLALGIDYWFAPSVVAKIGYEFNSGDTGLNTFVAQLSYGF